MVKDINTGSGSSRPRSMVIYKEKLYFFAADESYVVNLYSYDGTSVSIVEEKLYPMYHYGLLNYKYTKPIIYNEKLLFIAASDRYNYSLYSYDGN